MINFPKFDRFSLRLIVEMKSNSTTPAILLHLLFLLGSVYATDNEKKRYDGYRLYKVFVSDTTGLELLRNMYDDDGYHLWHPPTINNTAEVMIAPAKIQEFMEKVNTSKLEPELMMDDVQKYIDDENPRGNVRGGFDWLGYHRLDSVRHYFVLFYSINRIEIFLEYRSITYDLNFLFFFLPSVQLALFISQVKIFRNCHKKYNKISK